MDSNGNLIWVRGIGGADDQLSYFVTTDSFGNIYATGNFEGAVDFDPGPGVQNETSLVSRDIFTLKLYGNGDFAWVSHFASSGFDQSFGVNIGADNAVYSTGGFQGTADFDPTGTFFNVTSTGARDVYAHKIG